MGQISDVREESKMTSTQLYSVLCGDLNGKEV